MMSSSPRPGQAVPPDPESSPCIQNAGHTPWPAGTLIRDSNRPYRWVNLFFVSTRPDVYWHVPYQQPVPARVSLRAVMARFPVPSVETFSGRSV